jgi:hypothetical protein
MRYLRPAKIHAQILAAWSRRRPYPKKVYQQLTRLPKMFVKVAVRLMFKLLPARRLKREMRTIRSFVLRRRPDVLKAYPGLRYLLKLGSRPRTRRR